MLKLIPTYSQFLEWSIPSRATYIALVISIISVPSIVLFYFEAISSLILSLRPLQIHVESAAGSEIRISITNHGSRAVIINGAYLVALFPSTYKEVSSQLGVAAFSQNQTRAPFGINRDSTDIITVDARSIYPTAGLNRWSLSYHQYYIERFLWSLAQNNDSGSFFTCAIYLNVDSQPQIDNINFHTDDHLLHPVDCNVMLSIVGEFYEYQYGNRRYTKDPPRHPGERR